MGLFVRGALADAHYIKPPGADGRGGVLSYVVEGEDGKSLEVLSMEELGVAGEVIEVEVKLSVRKDKEGRLQDRVSIWTKVARTGASGNRLAPAGFHQPAKLVSGGSQSSSDKGTAAA